MADLRLAGCRPDDGDRVKTKWAVAIFGPFGQTCGQPPKVELLGAIERCLRREIIARACLDFNDDDRPFIWIDDEKIDFIITDMQVASDDPVPAPTKPSCGQGLAPPAQRRCAPRKWNPPLHRP